MQWNNIKDSLLIQQRLEDIAIKYFEKEFRSMCYLGLAFFEDTKRGRSLVKKKATVSPTPGLLILLTLTLL